MKFRTTLIAALLLGLFGAYVYFVEYKKAEEEKKEEEAAKKVFSLDWDEVTGLTIENAHGTFLLEKAGGKEGEEGGARSSEAGWRIREPVRAEADGATVNGLVGALKNLKVEQVVTKAPENPAAFGLTVPTVKIQIRTAEGKDDPPRLLVGDKSPVGSNAYAMREGDSEVLLLSTNLAKQFDKKLLDFRQKKIFTFQRDDVERVRVFHGTDLAFDLVREEGTWRLSNPIQARASEEGVNKILNKLTGLRVQSFDAEAPEDLGPYGLDDPAWRIEVFLAPDHTKASLLLGKGHEEGSAELLYAKRGERPAIVSLKSDLVAAFDRSAEELREKKVFPFKSWNVSRMDLVREGEEARLEKREGGKWWIVSPFEARADSGKVSSFLSALSRLEAVGFIPGGEGGGALADHGLDHPLARITLYEQKTAPEGEAKEAAPGYKPLGTIRFGVVGEEGEMAYSAAMEGDDTIYALDGAFFRDEMPKTLDALRSHKVVDVFRYQVASIAYRGPEGTVELDKKGGDWKLRKPESRDVEEKDVNALLSLVVDLEVERFLDDASPDLAALGLAPPARTITLKDEEGELLGTILLSDTGPGEDSLYVKAGGEAWVGVIPAETGEKLTESLEPFREEG